MFGILLNLLLVSFTWAQEPAPSNWSFGDIGSQVQMPQEEAPNSNTFELPEEAPMRPPWNIQMDLSGGFSSNVAQFEGSPSDNFLQFSPRLGLLLPLRDGLTFNINAGGFYRRFNKEDVDNNFRMLVFDGDMGIKVHLDEKWELGIRGLGEVFNGRELDFTENPNERQDSNDEGRDSKYFLVGGALSLGHFGAHDFFEVEFKQDVMRALTTTIDEAGNLFENSYNGSQAQIRYGRELIKSLDWEISYSFMYKTYLERRGRLDNGAIDPNFRTPFLVENEHSLNSRFYFYNLQADLGLIRTVDQVFGAETRTDWSAGANIPIKITSRFVFRPEVRWSSSFYDQFVGNIINDQSATDLRQDTNLSYGAEASLLLGWVSPVLNYRHTDLRSNYQIIEYTEDLYSAGLRVAF